MVRNLLASTAIATLIATGAYAQTTTTEPVQEPAVEMEQEVQTERAPGHLASNIIGESVYNSVADDAESIGNVNDIVIGAEGEADMVVIGVGGFLGLGERDVAISFDELEWSERDGQAWLVLNTTREALEAQPEFDVSVYDPALGVPPEEAGDDGMAAAPADDTTETEVVVVPADDATETDEMATAPADDATETDDMAAAPADEAVETDNDVAMAPVDGETDGMETGAVDRTTLAGVDMGAISADDLIGTTVYGANEENVGSVNDIILSDGGDVEAVIVDVGGFLGLGAKEVAIGMDNLEFMSDGDASMYLYTQFTEEQLEAQPEYDETTYAEQRDDQLLIHQR